MQAQVRGAEGRGRGGQLQGQTQRSCGNPKGGQLSTALWKRLRLRMWAARSEGADCETAQIARASPLAAQASAMSREQIAVVLRRSAWLHALQVLSKASRRELHDALSKALDSSLDSQATAEPAACAQTLSRSPSRADAHARDFHAQTVFDPAMRALALCLQPPPTRALHRNAC
eukprot:659246-Pleurochrysis_carterae.AAC.2